jgi:hypothetical protein
MISLRDRAGSRAFARVALAMLIIVAACERSVSDGSDVDDPTGMTGPLLPSPAFQETFEAATNVIDLFQASGTRWHGFQIQPATNKIEVTTMRSRTGNQSLLCGAAAGPGASKADIYLDRFHLTEGDEAWFEWWIWLNDWRYTAYMYIWDLESPTTCTDAVSCPAKGAQTICTSPGRRLYIGGAENRLLASDLGKWCAGEIMQQKPTRAVPFPIQSWVRLRVHIVLRSDITGRLEVWQDDVMVIDARGRTLPRSDSVYERMQIGITQNGSDFVSNAVFVDDVSVWLENPGWDGSPALMKVPASRPGMLPGGGGFPQ